MVVGRKVLRETGGGERTVPEAEMEEIVKSASLLRVRTVMPLAPEESNESDSQRKVFRVKDPETPEQWQAALDAVVVLLELGVDATPHATQAHNFGILATYGLGTVNMARCGEILQRAKALGYRPTKRKRG